MRSHRLNRLALLTQGVALIGLGAGNAACSKEPVNDPISVNSPPQTPEPPAWDAAAIHINAPPIPRDAEAVKASDAGK